MANRADIGKFLKDGNLFFSGGVDGGRSASDIGRDQLSAAINCTVRGGNCRPRPGWKKRKLTFSGGTKTPFQSGFYQCAADLYNGDTFNSLLSSQGGRQFKIDIDSTGPVATTSSGFVIPAVGGTVAVAVVTSNDCQSQSDQVSIGGKQFTLVSIDNLTQLTVKNTIAANVGLAVASGSPVIFPGTWQVSEITPTAGMTTTTTGSFTIPAAGSTVSVSVLDASKMVAQLPQIHIGAYDLVLVSVDSATSITVKNNISANATIVVASGQSVTFSVYDVNSPTQQLNWSIQAEDFWILQDNQSLPVIFDGSKTFRSNPSKKQIPVGNVMCYTQSRISVALPDRQSYRVGDILFGSSGTGGKDSILYYSENDYLNEGGDLVARVFGAPSASGDILAMKAAAMTDQSLGQGPMLVGTPNVVFSVNLPFDRNTWKNLSNALQTANPLKGPAAQNSTVLVNTDLWYRSTDGIRSYMQAQRQFNGSWGNTSQSSEMNEILADDTDHWLEFSSGCLFDNRLLMTCSPQMSSHGCYHRGLVALDFDLTTSIRKKLPPAWEGVWTGLRILQILVGIVNKVERCFMYVLNDASEIELWELTKADRFDDGDQLISWTPTLPSFNCGDSDRFKRLKSGRFMIDNLAGDLTAQVQFQADESSCWTDWATKTMCSKNQDCGPAVCSGPLTYTDQSRYPVRLPEPPDTVDEISRRPVATGFEFGVRIKFTGYGELKSFRIFCLDEPEMLGLERTDES